MKIFSKSVKYFSRYDVFKMTNLTHFSDYGPISYTIRVNKKMAPKLGHI